MGKPHRLCRDSYRGRVSVFITCTTHNRHDAFADPDVSRFVLTDLEVRTVEDIEITAWCLMPDHGHFLLTGRHRESDILAIVRAWKQATGFWYSSTRHRRLWQGNFWDWVLRDDDDALTVASYIVSNPIRSKLVPTLDEYIWWGSARWSREVLIANVGTGTELQGSTER